ncbi:hypothetical protein KKF84_21405 [Myxococcota bacterium]|nr:hypothetical protein [Myxococcota bacterium]
MLCWGNNLNGQLGNGSTLSTTSPSPVSGDIFFARVAAGDTFTCGLSDNNELFCWGLYVDSSGVVVENHEPQLLDTELVISNVSCGSVHCCALTEEHQAYCWGHNSHGQAGTGETSAQEGFTLIEGMQFNTLLPGGRHTCGIATDGETYCWGANNYGQLGNESTDGQYSPSLVLSTVSFQKLAAGESYNCAIDTNGEVWCWGLVDNSTDQQLFVVSPEKVSFPSDLTVFVDGRIHARGHVTCVEEYERYCWGQNTYGQLGCGDRIDHYTYPVRCLNEYSDAFNLVVGGNHTCGIGAHYDAWCWGNNSSGQLGDGTTKDSTEAVMVQHILSDSEDCSCVAGRKTSMNLVPLFLLGLGAFFLFRRRRQMY